MIWHRAFSVTGVAGTTAVDAGICSTAVEKIRVRKILVHVTGWADNLIVVLLNQTTIAKVLDKFFFTDESTGGTNLQKNDNRICEIPVEVDLALGEYLRVGIECGATAKNVKGSYQYEVVK